MAKGEYVPTRMSAAPHKLSFVVVGQFNQAILVPSWLAKHGLIGSGGRTQVFIEGGGETKLRHHADGLDWHVERGRLIVEVIVTESADSAVSAIVSFAAGILQKLPHTPVLAVGFNVLFELAPAPETTAGALGLADVAAALGAQPLTSSARFSCQMGDGTIVNVDMGHVPILGAPATEQIARYNFQRTALSIDEAMAAIRRAPALMLASSSAHAAIVQKAAS